MFLLVLIFEISIPTSNQSYSRKLDRLLILLLQSAIQKDNRGGLMK